MDSKMFCYQCQETAGCTGCTHTGVCGKKAETANLQDLLVYVTRELCSVLTKLRTVGQSIPDDANFLVTENLFITITNANFDDERIRQRVWQTIAQTTELAKGLADAPAFWNGSGNWQEKAKAVGVLETADADVRSLRELITYGLKGMAAYNHHIHAFGKHYDEIDAFLQQALAKTRDDNLDINALIDLSMQTGQYGVSVMAALDEANTSAYGNPQMTRVKLGVRSNPAILISGHDLHDLEMLLKQTEGTGVDVYTHSEMLPACSYPAFKKCCLHIIIRHFRSIRTLWVIMEMRGGNRRKNFSLFVDRCCSPPIVWCRRRRVIGSVFIQQVQLGLRAVSILMQTLTDIRIFQR